MRNIEAASIGSDEPQIRNSHSRYPKQALLSNDNGNNSSEDTTTTISISVLVFPGNERNDFEVAPFKFDLKAVRPAAAAAAAASKPVDIVPQMRAKSQRDQNQWIFEKTIDLRVLIAEKKLKNSAQDQPNSISLNVS